MAREPRALIFNGLPVVASATAIAPVTIATASSTAAAVTATTATAATATATATATTAIFPLAGFVHGQLASHEILTVEFLNGSLGFVVTGIGHEAEAARSARVTIIDDHCISDRPAFSERLPEIVICGFPIQAAHEYFISHNRTFFWTLTQAGKTPLGVTLMPPPELGKR